ncbi:MAG: hypothetical protein NTV01_21690 [Bacteroidia bacterium]|nr:hypothetical protein [Bacteroidia bacterium]
MSEPLDRIHVLLDQDQVTGIDFVHVEKDQINLKVYFYQSDTVKPKDLLASLATGDISIRSTSKTKLSVIPVKKVEWDFISGRDVLKINTLFTGDFTSYRLNIDSQWVDPYFNDVIFSFKVNCRSDLDCKTGEHECPSEAEVDFPIDYMARDFWSFRRALLDFASLKYPDWKERLEADEGIMLAEWLSAIGDELAYYQDRIAREAYLESASQRRSVRRHARLIDYDIDDGQGASTWLDCTVTAGRHELPAGAGVSALSDNGDRIHFEVGLGLKESIADKKHHLNDELNSLLPYIQDENSVCLPVGCTDMFLEGHHTLALRSFGANPLDNENGKWALLLTNPDDASIPARRHMIRLIKAVDTIDPLNSKAITHIFWEKVQALPFEICLKCNPEIHGNMVPVTAGKREEKLFITGLDPDSLSLLPSLKATIERAVEREGRDGSVTYLFSLPGSEQESLAWAVNAEGQPVPQIDLNEMKISGSGSTLVANPIGKWNCRRSLVGTYSSDANDPHYSLDDGTWRRVVGYQRNGTEIVHKDYASGDGSTIRFGDGEFGRMPAEGTIFKVTFRLGGGAKSNVPADSIRYFDTSDSSLLFISSVTNPLPATNGRDPESLAQIKKLAPYKFRSVTERAVIPIDYAQAAERLDWVQKAGASFRWTGSWLSAFVTADPKDAVELTVPNQKDLIRQLDRFRQAGREVLVMKPMYADLDLEITICVAPGSYRGEVKEEVLQVLLGKGGIQHKAGYFSADRFTFGTALNRSALEAAIQSVPGVNAVMQIRFKRRGWFRLTKFTDPFYDPGKDTIIRIENDPLYPERGSVKLIMEGGA